MELLNKYETKLNNPPKWLKRMIRDCEVASERIMGDSWSPFKKVKQN